MTLERLKKSHITRNIIIAVLVVGVISAIILNFTRAKYRVTESIPLVNGTINYSLPDLNIVAITIDREESDTLPVGNYELLDSSYCTIDGEDANLTINWDTETQALSITPFTTKGTKCYLDFAEVESASDTLLANYPTQTTRTNFRTTATYYGGYIRLYRQSNGLPTYECASDSDLYTTSGNENGNGALTYPIGLISMDEAWYAGGYSSTNQSYYLYTGQNYWTMSPSYFYSTGSAYLFIVSNIGNLSHVNVVSRTWGIRPVINLKADVIITGSGTTSNPYQVE